MAGIVHCITPKRVFDFGTVTSGQSLSVPLVRAVDVKDAKELQVVVRVHAFTLASGATIDVVVEQVSLTSEEPDADFVGSTVGSTLQLTSTGTAAPTLKVGTVSTFGHMVRVRVVGTRAGAGGACTATLSIDLVARDN